MNLTRRQFLGLITASAAAPVILGADKIFDGGVEDYPPPSIPPRRHPVLPPGAESDGNFSTRCVGCQLCVAACPNKVLRPSSVMGFPRPEMAFEKGYCRPECTKCGEVCPAGAIKRIRKEEKKDIHIGHAVWHKEHCLAARDGVKCTLCERHCPAHAIVRVALDPNNPDSVKVPVVDRSRCIGCGACEHFCPARPMPAIHVEGIEQHRMVRPMTDADVLAEVRRLMDEKGIGCVLVKDGVINATAQGGGIAPISFLLENRKDAFKGAWVIDKVVGRAAAAFAVAGGAAKVFGITASEDANTFLAKHGISLEADCMVPRILNRAKSGICPLEESVENLDDPAAMVSAARAKMREILGK